MKIPQLRATSWQKRGLFAADLALVALGVRTGYLVDVFAPRDPEGLFSRLLEHLRRIHPSFLCVFHLYEPTAQQSFFVNASLLPARMVTAVKNVRSSTSSSMTDPLSFVHLSLNGDYSLLPDPPADFISLLYYLSEQVTNKAPPVPLSVSLPLGTPQQIAIPLAALLLEYPVAYVPASAVQTVFLSGVPLDVYECLLALMDGEASREHTLLKFSCPQAIGEEHPEELGPSSVVDRLRRLFTERLTRLGKDTNVRVNHSIETLDRVAL